MPEEPPPPIVTISDPNNPGAFGDVIGGGADEEPWRPSRTAVRRALGVLLVLAVVAVPVVVVRARDHGRQLDARAATEVRLGPLATGSVPVSDNGVVPFALFNDGPHDVTVLSAHIDREGYPTQRLDVRIPHGTSGVLDVALPRPCPKEVSQFSQPRLLIVTVRTHRGSVVTKGVTVGDDYGFSYQESLRTTCGFLSASEAIEASVLGTTAQPRALVLALDVSNRARRAWEIRRVLALPGLKASTAGPVTLDATRGPRSVTGARFEVTLSVTSCPLARASTRDDPVDDYVAAALTLLTDGGAAEVYLDPDAQAELQALVQRSCR